MRTEHPGIEGGLCGFCPAFLNREHNREHQTGDASAVPVEERESQSSLPSVSSPSQTVTMSQLSPPAERGFDRHGWPGAGGEGDGGREK
jgi:hypothetical protein